MKPTFQNIQKAHTLLKEFLKVEKLVQKINQSPDSEAN